MSIAGGLAAQSWRGLKGHHIAVCSLIHFYVHDAPLNEASPTLSCLLAYIASLIFQVDVPSSNLFKFLQLLSAVTGDESGDLQTSSGLVHRIESLIQCCNSFSGLHAFFTKVERLLMTEELYDEIQGVTIRPAERQIDEQSPFGHFLQRCLDEYLGLEDNEFARLVRDVQMWISGEGGSDDEHDYNIQYHDGSSSLQRGDYALARAELEGFFDRSPNDAIHLSLQDALYRNAVFHHQTKAFEAAKASLNEALRLSRGANDMACVSSCDKLLRLIKYEEAQLEGSTAHRQRFPKHQMLSADELWQIESDINKGRPLISILSDVQRLSRPVKGKESDRDVSLSQLARIHAWQARIWSQMDNAINIKACRNACMEETFALNEDDMRDSRLQLALLESDHCNEADCRLEDKFRTLFDVDLIGAMDMIAFEHWQRGASRFLYGAMAGDQELQDALELHQPTRRFFAEEHNDTTRGDFTSKADEATFGETRSVSLYKDLTDRLFEARQIREDGHGYSTSFAIAVKVLRRSEEAQLFQLVGEATLECAESLLGLGNASRAKELLEERMTEVLTSTNSLFRGIATWVYSKILIKLSHSKRVEIKDALPWLDRARLAFNKGNHFHDLSNVIYIQWKLFESLDMNLEMQEAERDLLSVQKKIESAHNGNLRSVKIFESLIAQVGARVMAGV